MSRYQQSQINWSMSPMVKWLMIVHVGIWFVLQILLEKFAGVPFSQVLSLTPAKVLFEYQVWQLFTYMFLHTYSVFHILFNMLLLWMMGTELEKRWGAKAFLGYYIATGFGAAVIYTAGQLIYALFVPTTTALIVPVLGASGAIFGLMMAYGVLFGERTMYVMAVFPMKAKFMVMILGAVELASLLTSDVNGGNVAYLAHLGGLISGIVILWVWTRYNRLTANKKSKKKKSNLRLVVDNEPPAKAPKYWN